PTITVFCAKEVKPNPNVKCAAAKKVLVFIINVLSYKLIYAVILVLVLRKKQKMFIFFRNITKIPVQQAIKQVKKILVYFTSH
ncbi:hypothetical protein B4N84_17335, partial [Flavobacterium sp. IR1]